MLAAALKAAVAAYMERSRGERHDNGDGTRWWFAMGEPGRGESRWDRGRSRSPRHESTTGGRMPTRTGTAEDATANRGSRLTWSGWVGEVCVSMSNNYVVHVDIDPPVF